MEIVDAARVVNAKSFQNERLDVDVADDADASGQEADERRAPNSNDKIRCVTNGNATCKRRILHVNHFEFSALVEKLRHDEGRGDRRGEREIGIDDGSMANRMRCQGAVETGPEHPEKNGTCEEEKKIE